VRSSPTGSRELLAAGILVADCGADAIVPGSTWDAMQRIPERYGCGGCGTVDGA
jgi:hypothetical protein